MRGRKAIPIPIKRAKGTLQNCRVKDVPTPVDKIPRAPKWLNKRAKQIFWHLVNRRLKDIGLAKSTYTEKLALLSYNLEKVERFSKFLDENGYNYEVISKFGEITLKDRPEVQYLKEADRRSDSLLTYFGLDPASIQKVGSSPKKKKKSSFEEF